MSASNSHLRAILYALFGFAGWVTADSSMKLAAELGAAKYEIMAIAGPIGMAAIFIVTLLRGDLAKLRPHRPSGLALLALLFLLNYVCFITALPHMSLADFYTIIFMAPIIIAILAAVFLHEKINWQKGLAISAGFVGVIIAVNPAALLGGDKDWVSHGIAILGMLSMSVQMLLLRILGTHDSRESMSFYPRLGAFVGGCIGIVIYGLEPMTAKTVFYSAMTGIFGSIGWLFVAQAYRLAPAATVAPFQYSEILFGAVFGYFIWHNIPDAHLLLGAAIIVASGIYIVRHAHRAAALLKEEGHV